MKYYNVHQYGWSLLHPCDIHGNPIRRTQGEYPYSYDPFVVYSNDYKETDKVVYSDRLYSWDCTKYNECRNKVYKDHGQSFDVSDPGKIQEFLSLYFGRQVILTGIEQACNVSNGFPYWIFYYRPYIVR